MTARSQCVILCRVSSLKQAQEGESLDVQEAICKRYAESKGWSVASGGVWKTSISGSSSNRTDYSAILAYIRARPGQIEYCLFRSIDRLTRGGTGAYEQMKSELGKLGVKMIDTYGIIQPAQNTLEHLGIAYEWSLSTPSEIAEIVVASTSKNEKTQILTRMIGQEILLARQGYRTRCANDGFRNEKIYVDGKKKTIQAPDPERAHFYVTMYQLRAQGVSDPEIVERLNAMGFRTQEYKHWNETHDKIIGTRGGNPLTIKQLQRIIPNTIYAGVMCELWTEYKPIKAQYDGLVSLELWNRANRGKVVIKVLGDGMLELIHGDPSMKRRTRDNPLYRWRFIVCPHCGKPFLGSAPSGKSKKGFPTYHCARGHSYYGVPKDAFEKTIHHYVENLHFNPDFLNGLHLTFLNKYRQREQEIVKTAGKIHQSIAELDAEQASRIEAIVATKSVVVRERLEQEVEELEQRRQAAQRESQKIEITRDDIKSFIQNAKSVMEHPAKMLLKPRATATQRRLYELVFEEMPNYHQLLSGTPKLSLIFRLSSDFAPDEYQLVRT